MQELLLDPNPRKPMKCVLPYLALRYGGRAAE